MPSCCALVIISMAVSGLQPNFLDKSATTASTKKGVLSFYNFYTNILNAINKGFANLCDLELTIDEDTNKVIIRDINL